eukprot:TRINITY_DN2326_c0_g1_i13.p1 TRINITY_DN2326_c0_g1~~TRINITY_DN2326_c0_g1_i13.p1  ORF type:complete len:451 (-),score=81.27 TRINITY_DN2326_c0_g1_i13:1437-2789(-)
MQGGRSAQEVVQTEFPRVEGGVSVLVALQVKGKRLLVVGGGPVAAGRVRMCLEADAHVVVVCPEDALCAEVHARCTRGEVKWMNRTYDPADLHETSLVMAAVDDVAVGEQIARECRERKIPVNIADVPDLCDFYITSTIRDGPLQIGVSTNGQAPKLANKIRVLIQESGLLDHAGSAITRVQTLRTQIRSRDGETTSSPRRMAFLSQLCSQYSLERLAKLTDQEIYHITEEEYMKGTDPSFPKADGGPRPGGRIFLVGAGPGDPDLLTVKAARLLQQVDLVIADNLVPQAILDLVRGELRLARKLPGTADEAQDELNVMALEALSQGKSVVRIKSGDPFLFGRGGEELLFFRRHGYVAEVVPGLTSAIAAPQAAGIPVTHRGVADQVLITTGRGRAGAFPAIPDFVPTRTTVFLMGVARIDMLVEHLIEKGYPPDLPVAIIGMVIFEDAT